MDNRSFNPVTTAFEDTWPLYYGAGLVELALRAAETWIFGRRNRCRPPPQSVSMLHI